MLIDSKKPYDEIKRTALIYKNELENANKYYIVQLEKTKDKKFKITFKYGRRSKKPRITVEEYTNYSSACNIYNGKINY